MANTVFLIIILGFDVDLLVVERTDDNNVGTQISSSNQKVDTANNCSQTDVYGPAELPSGFSFDNLKSDEECKAWTGVTKGFFLVLAKFISSPSESESIIQRNLLICLAKLKTNLSFNALAATFSLNRHTVSRIFVEVLDKLHEQVKDLLFWFPKSTTNARMPAAFKAKYPNCRVIIDATEVKCEKPKTLTQQVQLYSNYKSSFTVKLLVGIAPSGEFVFISKAFGGRVTDTFLTVNSGILQLLEPGDVVLADKGFPQIEADVNNSGAFLVMPPFKRGDRQFSDSENSEGFKCSSLRIHVERAIRRLKYFNILSFLTTDLIPHIDKINVVIAFLCNNMPELIKNH